MYVYDIHNYSDNNYSKKTIKGFRCNYSVITVKLQCYSEINYINFKVVTIKLYIDLILYILRLVFMNRIEKKMSKYRLIVKLPNVTLNFHIEEYEIINNSYYKIFDAKTQTFRIFDSRICDLIEEVEEK